MTAPVALCFPGQGSQRLGMLEALPDQESVVRLLDAAEALTDLELRDVAASGTPEQLADTRAAQPLLFLTDWAWGSALLEAGLEPAAVAGHSLGELVALALAGVFSVEAGLELVVERSRLMSEAALAAPGGMSAIIGMEASEVSAAVEHVADVWVANDNAPGQVVVSGTDSGLEEARVALTEAGARRIVPLTVSGPFHSPLMEPAREGFATLLEGVPFEDARIPVLQNTDPAPATAAGTLRDRLAGQITAPVRWTGVMRELVDEGIDTLVEAGPGLVLKGLAKRVDGLTAYAVEESGLDAILEEVG